MKKTATHRALCVLSLLTLCLALLAAGCGGGKSPTEPTGGGGGGGEGGGGGGATTTPLTGTWEGTWTRPAVYGGGSGPLTIVHLGETNTTGGTVTLTRNGCTQTGTFKEKYVFTGIVAWEAAFPTTPCTIGAGKLYFSTTSYTLGWSRMQGTMVDTTSIPNTLFGSFDVTKR